MTTIRNDLYISQEKEGYLTLEDPNTKTPKLRWFVLTDNSIICYQSKDVSLKFHRQYSIYSNFLYFCL